MARERAVAKKAAQKVATVIRARTTTETEIQFHTLDLCRRAHAQASLMTEASASSPLTMVVMIFMFTSPRFRVTVTEVLRKVNPCDLVSDKIQRVTAKARVKAKVVAKRCTWNSYRHWQPESLAK